jgi:hypothetical protein
MLLNEPNLAFLEWMALNTRRNNAKEIKSAANHTPGLLRRLWSALRRGGGQVNLKSEPFIRPPSVAVS